jgi:septin family protein
MDAKSDPEAVIRRHKEIENYLRKEKKEYEKESREPKLLVLGTSDSGKSTFIKQLRILHGAGFSPLEKQTLKEQIMSNVASTMKILFAEPELTETLQVDAK